MKAKPSSGLKALALLPILAVAWPVNARADIAWNWSYLFGGVFDATPNGAQ